MTLNGEDHEHVDKLREYVNSFNCNQIAWGQDVNGFNHREKNALVLKSINSKKKKKVKNKIKCIIFMAFQLNILAK